MIDSAKSKRHVDELISHHRKCAKKRKERDGRKFGEGVRHEVKICCSTVCVDSIC